VIFITDYIVSIANNSVTIPRDLHGILEAAPGTKVYLVQKSEGHLTLYTPEQYAVFSYSMMNGSTGDGYADAKLSHALSNETTIEKGIRVSLPKRSRPGFKTEATIVFDEQTSEIEIWDPQTLKEHRYMEWD
jgi:DNA-binding transcriptional regulator/RsmH inhibitor MraZ